MTPRGRPPAGLEQTSMVSELLVLSTWLVVSTKTTSQAESNSSWILRMKSVIRTATYPLDVAVQFIKCCGILILSRCMDSMTDMSSKFPWFWVSHLARRLTTACKVGFTRLSASSSMSLSKLCFSWWCRRAWAACMPVKFSIIVLWVLPHVFMFWWFDQYSNTCRYKDNRSVLKTLQVHRQKYKHKHTHKSYLHDILNYNENKTFHSPLLAH